jgi:two-component system OmpR family response regulator
MRAAAGLSGTPAQHPEPQQLLDMARGQGVQQLDRSIDLLVSRLRHKLDDDPARPA